MVSSEAFDLTQLKSYEGVQVDTDALGAPVFENVEPIEASEIRACAYSIGDYNPLYTDPAYAKRSRFGRPIAPPYFFYAIDTVAPPSPQKTPPSSDSFGIPGARHVYGGNDWTFLTPIRIGDVVQVSRKFLRVEEKAGKFAGKLGIVYGEIRFTNQHGDLLAVAVSHLVVAPLNAAASRGKYKDETAFPTYSEEEQLRIASDKAEGLKLRGAAPRFYEDTHEGDIVTPTVQGPLWDTEIARFFAGWRMAPHSSVGGFPRRPEDAMHSFAPDPWTGGHTNVNPNYGSWQDRAMPRGFDSGMQRMSWLMRAVTSWMGDDADLKRLKGKLVRPNMSGDCTYYTGNVVAKRIENHEYLIDCELQAHDQQNRTNTVGECTIALPSKETWKRHT